MGDAMATTRVWDAFVRVFHWGLAASFAVAWITGEDWKSLHIWAGYAAGALIAMRLVWGMIGTHYARFAQFVRPPLVVAYYLRDIVTGREARYLGHNPAGGAMIVALLATLTGVCISGLLLTTDTFGDRRRWRPFMRRWPTSRSFWSFYIWPASSWRASGIMRTSCAP